MQYIKYWNKLVKRVSGVLWGLYAGDKRQGGLDDPRRVEESIKFLVRTIAMGYSYLH